MTVAKRDDWKTKPLPAAVKELPFQREFSLKDMEQVKVGITPKEMEDKWFIFFEDDRLNFHRSWTGHQIFQLTFSLGNEKSKVVSAIVNRDISEYNQQDDAYDIKFLNFLIDRLLLNRDVPFPSHDSIEQEKQSIYRHAMIGQARSNKEE